MQTNLFHPEMLLGSGPSAQVYCGVEMATGRKVRMKCLLPAQETPCAVDPVRVQLFAPSIMRLRHPQIGGLIAVVPAENQATLVSEFMPGMTIRALAAARQVQAADLRALAVQLMHALLAGEHLCQPHGDPKPSNVIVADHPAGGMCLQLQDWGLSLTRQAHPSETLAFRAPELHFGGLPTSQSDLFTAAASLFFLATNHAPVQGAAPPELVQQWQSFHAASLLQHLRPDMDQPFRDWLAWLMQPDPRLRPQCVSHALDVLMAALHASAMVMPQQALFPQMAPAQPQALQAMPLPAAPPVPPSAPSAAEPVPTSTPAPEVGVAAEAAVEVAVEVEVEAAPEPPAAASLLERPVATPMPAVSASASAAALEVAVAAAPAPTPSSGPAAKAAPRMAKASAPAAPVSAAAAINSGRAASGPGAGRKRVVVGVLLNLAALVVVGFLFWPALATPPSPSAAVPDQPPREAQAGAQLRPATDAIVSTAVKTPAKPAVAASAGPGKKAK